MKRKSQAPADPQVLRRYWHCTSVRSSVYGTGAGRVGFQSLEQGDKVVSCPQAAFQRLSLPAFLIPIATIPRDFLR